MLPVTSAANLVARPRTVNQRTRCLHHSSVMAIRIVDLTVRDIRFPTSQFLDGSDAMNPDPDYSAAYVVLHTNQAGLAGHGLTFTIGRGNDICCAAILALRHLLVGL